MRLQRPHIHGLTHIYAHMQLTCCSGVRTLGHAHANALSVRQSASPRVSSPARMSPSHACRWEQTKQAAHVETEAARWSRRTELRVPHLSECGAQTNAASRGRHVTSCMLMLEVTKQIPKRPARLGSTGTACSHCAVPQTAETAGQDFFSKKIFITNKKSSWVRLKSKVPSVPCGVLERWWEGEEGEEVGKCRKSVPGHHRATEGVTAAARPTAVTQRLWETLGVREKD